MGLFFKNMNFEEVEKAILSKDDGIMTWDDLTSFLQARHISEEKYKQLRINAHKKRAQAGNAESQYMYAILNMGTNNAEALHYYTLAAEQGHYGAMQSLALWYSEVGNLDGRGFGINPQKELEWLLKGAEAGDVNAMCDVARAYRLGDIVEKDHDQSEKWLLRAAQKGCAKAYYELAQQAKYWGNREKQMEFYKKALALKDIDEDTFISLSMGMGFCYFPDNNNSLANARLSAYCYSLAYILGNEGCADFIRKTGYVIPDHEWSKWVEDAKNKRLNIV